MQRCLVDTGILVRLFMRSDPQCQKLRKVVGQLHADGLELVAAIQNAAELLNVATRPVEARGGFGLTNKDAMKQIAVLERMGSVVSESIASYAIWKKLAEEHQIKGVAVHDARLVSVMITEGIRQIVTLNDKDFLRYKEIEVLTPQMILNEDCD